MNKEEARSAVMCAISMALKDPILQQGFECICKENAELREVIDNDVDKKIYVQLANKAKLADVQKVQLTKAKDFILKLTTYLEGHTNYDFEYELIKEVKQFLKESEVEK